MSSINLRPKDGGGDDGSRSSIRSPRWSNIVTGDSDELPTPSSSSIQEQIVNPCSDLCPQKAVTESASSPDDSATECQPSDNDGGGSNAVKKPVWSKPSNGVSPVMGAVSWPALGESTKASPKSSSSESLRALSDGSLLPALPVTGSASPSPLKLSNANNAAPSGQRSMRRLPATHDSRVEAPHNPSGQRGGFGGNDNHNHNHQRNSYRRGSYQNRGNQNPEWNQHRNYNNRDNTNVQPHRDSIRPPYVHTSTPFFHPQMHMPVRPFAYPPDMAAHMYYLPGPFPPVPPFGPPMPAPLYYPVADPILHAKIVKQIDYYFSNENLVKDTHLRKNMDEQGWVSVNVIANFKMVRALTENVALILDAMRTSALVEVQGEKMRRRNDWKRWLIPPGVAYSNMSTPEASPRADTLASHFNGIALNEEGFERATVA